MDIRLSDKVDIKKIKVILIIISLGAIGCMVFYNYDNAFRITSLLPCCYLLCTLVFLNADMICGINSLVLVILYAFRMCILPVICALGNFYLEPDKEVYIQYYPITIFSICVEGIIVFLSLTYLSKKYRRRINNYFSHDRCKAGSDSFVSLVSLGIVILLTGLAVAFPALKGYYYLVELGGMEKNFGLQELGTPYYIFMLLEIIGRPIIVFVIVGYLMSKKRKSYTILAVFVSILNCLIMSDRRIASLLISLVCFAFIFLNLQTQKHQKKVIFLAIVAGLAIVAYCFQGNDTFVLLARKFQRYFSGPTLTAIGFAVEEQYNPTIIEFIKGVLNCSQVFTGIFQRFNVPEYPLLVCGPAGYSIWNPVVVGFIQYVGVLFPIPLFFVVKFIAFMDYKLSTKSSNVEGLIYIYMGISIAIYLVMYTAELVVYNIAFIFSFYLLLLFFNKRVYLRANV